MTSIGGHQLAAMLANRQQLPTLAAGQNLEVRVLGSTRHGVSVMIGQERYQLDVPSRLADAATLTLQGTASSSTSGRQKVQVVAQDDRPLSKPIAADLIAKPQLPPSVNSAVVLKSKLQVIAQPISAEGKATGPSIPLLLQAQPPTADQPTAVKPASPIPAPPEGTPTAKSDAIPGDATTKSRQSELPSPAVLRPQTNISSDRQSAKEAPRPMATGTMMPSEGVQKETRPRPIPAPASAFSADPQAAAARRPVSDVRSFENPLMSRQNAATSPPPMDGAPASTRSLTVAAVSTYRSGPGQDALSSAGISPQSSKSAEPHPAPDRNQAVAATVVERTGAGKIVLEVAGQRVRIEQPVDLPLGTTLAATFTAMGPTSAASINPAALDGSASPLTELIELLDDIDRAGRQATDPDRPVPARQLPMPDKHLAARFLGLLAAESRSSPKGAEPSPFEPRGATAAQSDRIQTLVRDLGSVASETLAEGWKSLALPIGTDQTQAVCFYYRDHTLDPDGDGGEEATDGGEAQRAIFDVSFSRLGRCQIDALCRDRRFDLLIRSERPLMQQDRRDIAGLLASACEIAGVNGEIGFRVGSFFEPERSPAGGKDFQT